MPATRIGLLLGCAREYLRPVRGPARRRFRAAPVLCPITRRWLASGLVIVFGLVAMPALRAESPDGLKAAFVLNFVKFAEWPAAAPSNTHAALVIAAIGNDPLAVEIKTILNGKLAQGRKVEVQLYRDVADWKQCGLPCQALFVTVAAYAVWDEIRGALVGRTVLTMGDAPGFCAAGGMLNLYEKENRIRFEANPEAAEKEGLKLRAELLKLATIVKPEKVAP